MSSEDGRNDVRQPWRLAVRRWALNIPSGSDWKALGSGFIGFLHYIGDVTNFDGANDPKFTPSLTKQAKVMRTSIPTLKKWYNAAAAAHVLNVEWTESGARLKSCHLRYPIGDTPNWVDCLAVLRDDWRIEHKETSRADKRRDRMREALPEQTKSPDWLPEEYKTLSPDVPDQDETLSRDVPKHCHLTSETLSPDRAALRHAHNTPMADAVLQPQVDGDARQPEEDHSQQEEQAAAAPRLELHHGDGIPGKRSSRDQDTLLPALVPPQRTEAQQRARDAYEAHRDGCEKCPRNLFCRGGSHLKRALWKAS